MIRAQHVSWAVCFFNRYSTYMVKRHFRHVFCHDVPAVTNKPILIIANHFSWWDGFFAVYCNARYFRKTFHVMMLEEQLSLRKILRFAGAFSVRKNSRSIANSLEYAAEILQNKNNLLLLFPQGRFYSLHDHSFRFEKGVGHILQKSSKDIHLLFMANMIEYFAHRKPFVSLYFKEYPVTESLDELEKAYSRFFDDCIKRQNAFMES